MGRFTPREGFLTQLWVRLQPGGSVAKARPAALTRMLGSSRECRARMIASSETRVSPLVWISSTAIWGSRSAAMSACGQSRGLSSGASQRDLPWQGGSCGAPHWDTPPGQAPGLPGSPVLPGHASLPSGPVSCLPQRSRVPGSADTASQAPRRAGDNANSTNSPPVCPGKSCLEQSVPALHSLPSQGCHSPRRRRRHRPTTEEGSRRGELSLLLHAGQGGSWQQKMFC